MNMYEIYYYNQGVYHLREGVHLIKKQKKNIMNLIKDVLKKGIGF